MRQRKLRQLMAMVVHLTPSPSAHFRLNYGLPLGSRPTLSDRAMTGLAGTCSWKVARNDRLNPPPELALGAMANRMKGVKRLLSYVLAKSSSG